MVRKNMLYFAELDYNTVLHLKEIIGLEDSCLFHCEQMIEKLLKQILLLQKGERDYKHTIVKLVSYLDLSDYLHDYLDLLQELQDSYFDRRYEVFNYVEYSRDEYMEMFDRSIEVYKLLLSKIEDMRFLNSSIFQ